MKRAKLKQHWSLIISAIAIVIIIGLSFLIIFDVPNSMIHWKLGKYKHMVPNYMLGIFSILLIIALLPLSYYFISRRIEENFKKNIQILSKLVNKNLKPEEILRSSDDKNIILKFLNINERRVLEKLIEENGKVFQSEISKMEDMTKLKTHRAVKSLEKKGIIKLENYGKTNRIILTKDVKDILLKL